MIGLTSRLSSSYNLQALLQCLLDAYTRSLLHRRLPTSKALANALGLYRRLPIHAPTATAAAAVGSVVKPPAWAYCIMGRPAHRVALAYADIT